MLSSCSSSARKYCSSIRQIFNVASWTLKHGSGYLLSIIIPPTPNIGIHLIPRQLKTQRKGRTFLEIITQDDAFTIFYSFKSNFPCLIFSPKPPSLLFVSHAAIPHLYLYLSNTRVMDRYVKPIEKQFVQKFTLELVTNSLPEVEKATWRTSSLCSVSSWNELNQYKYRTTVDQD